MALEGIPVASYTSYDLDMLEQFKETSRYKSWKKQKEKERKAIIASMKKKGKIDYQEAFNKVYGKYINNTSAKSYEPRLVI